MAISRRRFVAAVGAVGAGWAMRPWVALAQMQMEHGGHGGHVPAPAAAPAAPAPGSGLFARLDADRPLTLRARPLGRPGVPALAYAVESGGRTLLNPTLVVRKGAEFRATLVNGLAEPTTVHWHGLDADWKNTGHPSFVIPPGATQEFAFPVVNRAATYWYHAHPDMLTAKQVYLGLAGFFLVEDDDERALAKDLDLALGSSDLPLLLQDKRLDPAGSPVYAPSEEDLASGLLGDAILVNAAPAPRLACTTRAYRLRLLNGSNARTFCLALEGPGGGLPLTLIAGDAGLLDRPREAARLFLAPGERAEVLAALRRAAPGQEFTLRSLAFDPMHQEAGGHGGGHDGGHGSGQGSGHGGHGGALPDGAAFPVLTLAVTRKEPYDRTLPATLTAAEPGPADGPVRRLALGLDPHTRRWTINGTEFRADQTPIVLPRRGPEVWEFANPAASMPHPMHLHGYTFRVRERRGSPAQVRTLAADPQGRLAAETGTKDTVLVWPGETVRVLADFSRPAYAGEQTFVVHCHNLEHEDHGMMLNFKVPAA